MTSKLTKAQSDLLTVLSKGPRFHIAGKPETRALRRRALVEVNEFGAASITPAGRAALEGAGRS